MIAFCLRRALSTGITAWLALTIAFVALHALPGEAIAAQLTQSGATMEQIAARRAELGLDQSLPRQYLSMWVGLLHGDLGRSLASDRPVSTVLAEQFGATVQLATAALAFAVVLGLGLGLLAGLVQHRLLRGLVGTLIALTISSPIYWTGTLAIYVFSVWLKVLPSSGGGDVRHLILPAATLGLALSGGIAQVTAANVRETAAADFVQTARAKGLKRIPIISGHILRPSLVPIFAVISLQAGFLLGGAAITEALFVRQGIGQLLLNAINAHDYSIVQGAVILAALTFSLLNTAADLIAALIDPRLVSRFDAR